MFFSSAFDLATLWTPRQLTMDQTHGCVLFSKIPFAQVLQKSVVEHKKNPRKAKGWMWDFGLFWFLGLVFGLLSFCCFLGF